MRFLTFSIFCIAGGGAHTDAAIADEENKGHMVPQQEKEGAKRAKLEEPDGWAKAGGRKQKRERKPWEK